MSSHENDPTRSWAQPPGPDPRPGRQDPVGGRASGQQPSYDAPGEAQPYQHQPYQQQPYQQQPYGSPPGYGQQPAQEPYGAQQYEGQQYGSQQYGAQQYGSQQYGAQQYGGQEYGAQQYGAQPGQYGAAQYGQPYGQYGQPDAGGPPRRPASVVLAAVLGFLFGALALLMTLAAFAGGAALLQYLGETGEADARAGAAFIGIVGGLLLVWTVLLIWGAIWALTGRSRVLLLVGGAIAVAFTALAFLGSLADVAANGAGGVVGSLLFLAAALGIVVPLLRKPAARFFTAHRTRRLG